MAIDTRNKRASILGLALAAQLVLPAPDATIAQADRQQVAFTYAGIAAQQTAPTITTTAGSQPRRRQKGLESVERPLVRVHRGSGALVLPGMRCVGLGQVDNWWLARQDDETLLALLMEDEI